MRGQVTEEEMRRALCLRHTEEVQRQLSSARVAVAGLGGLGSHIAFLLARIGVGYLHLVDFDRVELTNLNRQQYRLCHLGQYKTEALQSELMELNPFLHISADCVKVDEKNLPELFAEDLIICEAFDRAEQKEFLSLRGRGDGIASGGRFDGPAGRALRGASGQRGGEPDSGAGTGVIV